MWAQEEELSNGPGDVIVDLGLEANDVCEELVGCQRFGPAPSDECCPLLPVGVSGLPVLYPRACPDGGQALAVGLAGLHGDPEAAREGSDLCKFLGISLEREAQTVMLIRVYLRSPGDE